jgi:hypothetical protein
VKSCWRVLSILLITLALISCGGGGSNDAAVPPRADAGEPQKVEVGATVTLDGSASSATDGATLTYFWALTSRPTNSIAELFNPTAVRPILAPDIAGDYVVSLVVNDGTTSSTPASLTVTAIPPPIPRNATLSISWGGTISDKTVGGLDITIGYDQNLATFSAATSGSLTRQWLISTHEADNNLRAALIGSTTFAADSSTGTVLFLDFTPLTHQLTVDDFSVIALSVTDPNYNTQSLNPAVVVLGLELND